MGRKVFKTGDIVYWCKKEGYEYSVGFGRVDEHLGGVVYIDYLVLDDRRTVSSAYFKDVPVKEFQSETSFHKLPKGWSYDTELYQLGDYAFSKEERKEIEALKISDKNKVRDLYDRGILVKKQRNRGVIDVEITTNGYRIVKRFYDNYPTSISLLSHNVYDSYEEAKREVDKYVQEFIRQSELSDYEWSIEQIDKSISTWAGIYGRTDREIAECREFLLMLERVEDIETRVIDRSVQWKYIDRKRWSTVPCTEVQKEGSLG